MKKLIILSLLMGVLTACGDDGVNTTSKSYKKDLLTKAYKDDDTKSLEKYLEIKRELKELAKSGNEKADEELEKWSKVEEDFRAEIMIKITPEMEEHAKKIREKYKNH